MDEEIVMITGEEAAELILEVEAVIEAIKNGELKGEYYEDIPNC